MKKNSSFNKGFKKILKVYLEATSIYGECMTDIYCRHHQK